MWWVAASTAVGFSSDTPLPLLDALAQIRGRRHAEKCRQLATSEDGQLSVGVSAAPRDDQNAAQESAADPYLKYTHVLLSLPRSLVETDGSLKNGTLSYFLDSPAFQKHLAEKKVERVPTSFVKALFYLYHLHARAIKPPGGGPWFPSGRSRQMVQRLVGSWMTPVR